MKQTITVYLLSSDTDEGFSIDAFQSVEARNESIRKMVTNDPPPDWDPVKWNQCIVTDLAQAWEDWRENKSNEEDYYGTEEQTIEIDVPIADELLAALERIVDSIRHLPDVDCVKGMQEAFTVITKARQQ